MKHLIITRLMYEDKNLLDQRIALTRKILIPDLLKQKNQNFVLAIMAFEEDFMHMHFLLEDYPDIKNLAFSDYNDLKQFCIKENFQIQTRHDSDDGMHPEYIEKIQTIAKDVIDKGNTLIQFQPTKKTYPGQQIIKMPLYTHTYNSGFLSLVQNKVTKTVYQRSHILMHTEADQVVTVPEGYVTYWWHDLNNSHLPREVRLNQHKF